MNLILLILVSLEVILEAHICLAGYQTHCGKNFENEVELQMCSGGCRTYCGKPCQPFEFNWRPPKGVMFYFNAWDEFIYCDLCRGHHLANRKEDWSLLSWLKTAGTLLLMIPPPITADEKRPCKCPCHIYVQVVDISHIPIEPI